MEAPVSDALVFFGATGDLAFKQIFPALQALVTRGRLTGPVIGVAKAHWNLDQFIHRARESVQEAWRVVEPILGDVTPMHEYEAGTWGPPEADALIAPHGQWRIPR